MMGEEKTAPDADGKHSYHLINARSYANAECLPTWNTWKTHGIL